MAKLINLNTYHETEGNLAVLELPVHANPINRIFCIYNNSSKAIRGKHRHKKSSHILICAAGSCEVFVDNGKNQQVFFLNNPNEALFLEPADWREMYNFSENSVLFCLSDEIYDPNDYIYTPYVNNNNLVLETNTFNQ